jgi:hypothetical protein
MYLKLLGKQEQTKPQSRWGEIMKIRVEITEMEIFFKFRKKNEM